MGRRKQTQPLVDVEFVRDAFMIGSNSGQIVRRSTGEVATFTLNGKLLVRVYHQGQVRRVMASRVAWAIASGSWPKGVVRARNGVDDDLRFENLIVTRHGRDPFGAISSKHSKGGKASSLERRAKTTTTLINALAEHPGLTVPQISKLVGSSTSCTCVRLSKLADAGLCVGPKCDARARWDLSQKGRELAAQASNPVVLDQLARQVLSALALAPTRLLALARRVGCCSLTPRRRIDRLVAQKLIETDGRRFTITSEGREMLGDSAPQRWIDPDRIRASTAKDVGARLQHPNDDRSSWVRARQSSRARQKGIEKAQANKAAPFNAFPEWLLTG
jgi:hypothetical protein